MHPALKDMKIALSMVQQLMESQLQNYLLTRSQMEILLLIKEHVGIEHRALLETLQVTSPTLTGVLNHLEKQQLIERHPSPTDRRVRLLYITKEGQVLTDELDKIANNLIGQIFDDFSSDELEMLSALLQRIIKKVDNL